METKKQDIYYFLQLNKSKELKQYLSAFALLNYEDSKVNRSTLDKETLENVRKLIRKKDDNE